MFNVLCICTPPPAYQPGRAQPTVPISDDADINFGALVQSRGGGRDRVGYGPDYINDGAAWLVLVDGL